MRVELTSGRDRAVVDPDLGGRVASVVVDGRELLLVEPLGGSAVEPALAWGSFLMAPFVGRLSGGRLTWDGRAIAVPLNHGHHAIHGTVFDAAWTVVSRTDTSVEMTCEFDPGRWPFRGRCLQRIALEDGALTMEATVEADEPMPAALGWHPWFVRGGHGVRVGVAGDHVLRLTEDLLPTGTVDSVDSRTDLRGAPEIGARNLDDVYASVQSPAKLCWPDLNLEISFGPSVGSVVVYAHPQAVCVEPITAWPDAVRLAQNGSSQTGLASLRAGERLTAWSRWAWTKTRP